MATAAATHKLHILAPTCHRSRGLWSSSGTGRNLDVRGEEREKCLCVCEEEKKSDVSGSMTPLLLPSLIGLK